MLARTLRKTRGSWAARGPWATRSLFITTATTPNENALKFLPSGVQVLPHANQTVEFLSAREAHHSPLAVKLFAVDGVKLVMFGLDFITVQKTQEQPWGEIKPEVFLLLTELLTLGEPVVGAEHAQLVSEDIAAADDDTEVVLLIKELIFTRIKPALQDDGGDIEFVDFVPTNGEEGVVLLRLRGACRLCDSSSATLQNGIESMLKHYVEEVAEVLQVSDLFAKGDDHTAPGALADLRYEDEVVPEVELAVLRPKPRGDDMPPSL